MNQLNKNSSDLLDQLLDVQTKPYQPFNSSFMMNSNSYLLQGQLSDMPVTPKYLLKESNGLNSFKYDVNQSKDIYNSIDDGFKKTQTVLNFDDAPIGKSNFQINEIGVEQQKSDNLSLEQKIAAKSVKIRMNGFDQLFTVISTRNQYDFNSVKDKLCFEKLLKESNPGCFEKILTCYREAVIAGWITSNEEQLKQVIQNGFTSSKPLVKKMSTELIQTNFEIPSGPSSFENIILQGLKSKTTKVVNAYISLLTELLSTYGIKKLNYLKLYYSQIVNLLNNQKNANIKNDAIYLLKQCVKWVGIQLVLQYTVSLKETLKKQLQKMWEQYDRTIMVPKKGAAEAINTSQTYIRQPVNIYDIADEVDVLKKFPQKWSDEILNAAKWNDKTSLIQELIDACNVPKIAPNEFRHILDMCKRLLQDSNQNVVISILRLLGALGKGLRRNFYSAGKSVFLTILMKFREKKTQLIEEVTKCLDLFLLCFNLEEAIEDLKEGINDKNPHMRYQVLEWLNKCLSKTVQEKNGGTFISDRQKEGYKNIESFVQKLNSDGAIQVRDAAKRVLQIIGSLLDKQVIFEVRKSESKSQSRQPSKEKRKSLEKDSKKKHNTSIMSNTSIVKSKYEGSESSSILINNTSGYKADISNQLIRLIPKLNDTDWEKRKSGLDELQDILDQYHSIHTNGIYDLLPILKTRILDANKQLARQTIHIIGKLIESAGKQSKPHARSIVPSLVDVLAEKNESIRKQSINTLTQIGKIVGMEVVLHPMSQCLETQKIELKSEILKFLLANQDQLSNIKQFIKGIVFCLCDKSKEIRIMAEKIFEKTWETVGLSVYKAAAKEKPTFAKQLGDLFGKFEKNNNSSRNNSSESKSQYDLLSRLASPRNAPPQIKHFPPSNKKSTPSLNRTLGTIPRYPSTNQISITNQKQQYQGEEPFAPVKTLTTNRVQRSEQQETKTTSYLTTCDINTQDLISSLKSNIRKDIVSQMTSLDYQKVVDVGSGISKLCKDLVAQTSLRQIYDLIFKWVYIRLWGGNSSVSSLFDLVSQILAILEKKNIVVKQVEVDLILSIVREYFLSVQHYSKDQINLVLRCLIKVSVGSTVLKYLLKHFSIDVNSIHHHLKKDITYKYKQFLIWMVKNNFMEYLQSQQIMMEVVKIRELAGDEEFLNKIYSMFNEGWLNQYGFRKINYQQPSVASIRSAQSNNTLKDTSFHQIDNKKKSLSRNQSKGILNNTIHASPRSASRTPRGASQFKQVEKRTGTPTPKAPANNVKLSNTKKAANDYELPLYAYAWPTQLNPIYEHLNNLCPASESTATFFETLFIQTSEKISNQLQTYAKVIMGSLFKGLTWTFEHRNQIHPEKIIHQAVLIQKAAKNPSIIRNCDDILLTICDYLLNQLVEEDENKFMVAQKLRERNITFSLDNFGKCLNVCMLRILEFAEPNFLIIILFQLLTKCIKNRFTSSPRLPTLILKCIYKMTANYVSKIKENMLPGLFRQFHNYNLAISEVDIENDEGSLRIKDLLTEIAAKVKEKIWLLYDKANISKDTFIIKHLKTLSIVKQKLKSSQNVVDEELKSITQMLARSKTYDNGIALLSSFMDKYPAFQLTQYYLQKEYDHKFISRVLASLESKQKRPVKQEPRGNSDYASPTSNSSSDKLINQIRSLKQQREHNESRNERDIGKSKEKYSPRSIIKVNEYQKKIAEMGSKISNRIK